MPSGYGPERRAKLGKLEAEHFWFPPRNRLIVRTIARETAARRGGFARAIDLGCGCGIFVPDLKHLAAEVVAVDAYRESLVEARPLSEDVLLLQADVSHLPLAADQFDLLVALDVLEHVDPARFLAEAARLARPNARLVVTVPAAPTLWSELDRVSGHRRRYTLAGLAAELASEGWTIVRHDHYQALLFPLVWMARKMFGRRQLRVEHSPGPGLGGLLGAVNSLEVALGRWVRWGWGTSLLAVGRRAGE